MCKAAHVIGFVVLAALVAGCNSKKPATPAGGPGMQAMPVQVQTISLNPVPDTDTYLATIKSRRSATMQPQVEGNLTKIFVHSGQVVKAGQVLMQIDPLKQMATVQAQQGTEAQQRAVYQYNQSEVERQKRLYDTGIISKQAYDQAVQSYQNSKGAFEASAASVKTQRAQLAYYQIRAPFSGVVGDIPVHLGDYVSTSTLLTTVDENKDLEAYIYIPTERSADVHMGLPVEIIDSSGKTLAKSNINFISPQVENNLQSILAKAPIARTDEVLRNAQLVKARVTWSTHPKPTVPVLAVTRMGGASFVFVAKPEKGGYVARQVPVTLDDPIGNDYPVLKGLNAGDKVILSGIQFLQDGAPVKPLS
ncbi:MAG: efflux RND transporter periplasmic adaptor subunit [Acidobacteria bacterium]|nr:efflux RND transporter periplasmic adaptor subunit [Acidobacteriota bacterium]